MSSTQNISQCSIKYTSNIKYIKTSKRSKYQSTWKDSIQKINPYSKFAKILKSSFQLLVVLKLSISVCKLDQKLIKSKVKLLHNQTFTYKCANVKANLSFHKSYVSVEHVDWRLEGQRSCDEWRSRKVTSRKSASSGPQSLMKFHESSPNVLTPIVSGGGVHTTKRRKSEVKVVLFSKTTKNSVK